jgi:hypothetical protein
MLPLRYPRTAREERPAPAAPERPPACPQCGGRLLWVHAGYRCSQCRFAWCAGCETGVCPESSA